MKLVSRRRKVKKLGKPTLEIEGLVAGTSLSSLNTCSLDIEDRGLLYTFADKWHKETSSFHMLIREISITLNDVASVLHLPIIGVFHTYDAIDVDQIVELLVELLGVTTQKEVDEIQQCKGACVRLAWLQDIYRTKCLTRQWTLATKAYLLHIKGCSLFVNKSSTHIGVVSLEYIR